MNGHILRSFMWLFREMASNLFSAFFHVIEVSLESIHESPLCLSHILNFASGAGNAVNQIVGFAADFLHAMKDSVCRAAVDGSTFINQWAISTPGVRTRVVTS